MTIDRLWARSTNLSKAWAETFIWLAQAGERALSPLVITIREFDDDQLPIEDPELRGSLDRSLKRYGTPYAVETVANTIFPHTFWKPGIPKETLYRRYLRLLPRLRRFRGNYNGLYFERLIAFPGAPHDGNQLETILAAYHKMTRRKSALQASVFDPSQDLTELPTRGFHCMQHVAFAPTPGGTLNMSAFYASQYLYERAYGNYLGLCRLGRFMAFEMGLKLESVTCYVGFAQRGEMKAGERDRLASEIAERYEAVR